MENLLNFYHVEQEMLRYALAKPANRAAHHQWLDRVYDKLDEFKRQGVNPQDYVLVELTMETKIIAGANIRPATKLVWRKKEKVSGPADQG